MVTAVLTWETISAITRWYSSTVEEVLEEADDRVPIARLRKCTWLSFWSQPCWVGVTMEWPGVGSTRVLSTSLSSPFVSTWLPEAAMVLDEHVKADGFPLFLTARASDFCLSIAFSISRVELMPTWRQDVSANYIEPRSYNQKPNSAKHKT